jgi:spore coat protein A
MNQRSGTKSVFAFLCAGLAAFAFGVRQASADSVTIIADADGSIYEDNQTNANGAGTLFHVGNNGGGNARRALIRFPVTTIPAGSTITSVTMTLVVDHTNDGPGSVSNSISVYRLTQAWLEGPLVAPGSGGSGTAASTSADNSATWSHRIYNANTWSTPGGTHVAAASATTNVAESTGAKTWSGAGLVADVQAWVDGTANNGWILKGNETTNASARNFRSRQHATVSSRPKIDVVFTPPATTGRCCLPDGSCLILNSANCASQGGTYAGNGTNCSGNPCPQPTGACCFGNGSCSIQTPTNCATMGGTYAGNGVTCAAANCPVLTGACCFSNATCQILSAADCGTAGGNYKGDNTTCETAGCNWVLAPFVDALPIPPVAQPISGVPGGAATYEIPAEEFYHRFHTSLPLTRVWGYDGIYPGPTIEARKGMPVYVTWKNDLRDTSQRFLPLLANHRLAVSTCLHGPDVTGTVPMLVTHLHGAKVAPESDGDPDATFAPGSQSTLYHYPNNQDAATMWYHDHALGLTRLNVYMGLAGFYLLRDSVEDTFNLPSGENEIPLVFQDRSFNADGSLKFNPTFQDHFFGDFIVVNGKVNPYLDVKRGKYRFRLLNGSNTRTFTLVFGSPIAASPVMYQIGTDLGLRAAPLQTNSITLMPGERADVVVDFAGMAAGAQWTVFNTAVAPFPGGVNDIRTVMQFRVGAATGHTAALPASLVTIPAPAAPVQTRQMQLQKFFDAHCGHDIWQINSLFWDDIVDFPMYGTTEQWEFVNRSGLAHPMHIHLVRFQIINREDFTVDINGNIIPSGSPVSPPATDQGWKDTVQATPNQITRVRAKFEGFAGTFPFHCHILDHEDHEMMRQFTVLCPSWSIFPGSGANDTLVNFNEPAYFGFSVITGGNPVANPKYEWYKAGSPTGTPPLADGPTGNGSTIAGATTQFLTIFGCKEADEGAYYCVITDACGVVRTTQQGVLTVACPADLDDGLGRGTPDGGVDINDLLYFLAQFQGGEPGADLDDGSGTGTPDGGVDINDLLYFLDHFEGGC